MKVTYTVLLQLGDPNERGSIVVIVLLVLGVFLIYFFMWHSWYLSYIIISWWNIPLIYSYPFEHQSVFLLSKTSFLSVRNTDVFFKKDQCTQDRHIPGVSSTADIQLDLEMGFRVFFSLLILVGLMLPLKNLADDTLASLSILRKSRWRSKWQLNSLAWSIYY